MIISGKAQMSGLLLNLPAYSKRTEVAFVKQFHALVLAKKVRFPILEFAAAELYNRIPVKEQIAFTDRVIDLHEIGGNIIAGFMLQLRLNAFFKQSLDKAVEYIIAGDEWYVCDIIGERVMGYALLTLPEKTLPALKKFTKHDNKWIVRSVGVATHYAVKKGLKKEYAAHMFRLLLTCSNTTDFHTKKGIGWAAKTIARFHPDVIKLHEEQLETDPTIKQWFKTKIRIGLGRSFKYAARHTG